MTAHKEDWADRAAQHFQLTHAKFCQGPNATVETESRWRAALAYALRSAYNRGRRGKPVRKMAALPCLIVLSLFLRGCSSLRGYKFANRGPGDTSTGDVTHASDPGARVVIPKKAKQQPARPYYIMAFERPNSSCVEIEHKVGSELHAWACAAK